MHMLIFNDETDNILSRFSKSSSISGSVNDFSESNEIFPDMNQDNESNSKLDSYLDEIIELIIRDFLMVWLGELLWDKEKFSAMTK